MLDWQLQSQQDEHMQHACPYRRGGTLGAGAGHTIKIHTEKEKIMKLKAYLAELNKLVESNPEALEFEVVTSIDDEGNGYNIVNYGPGLGALVDGEWDDEIEIGNPATHVCLN